MDEFIQDLNNIILDDSIDQRLRNLAKDTLSQWLNGIIPSPKTLRTLRKAAQKPLPCTRVQHNGGCGWLRKHGKLHNLPVPPVGEPARCLFGNEQHKCPGYSLYEKA
jgi:hypothetical protein